MQSGTASVDSDGFLTPTFFAGDTRSDDGLSDISERSSSEWSETKRLANVRYKKRRRMLELSRQLQVECGVDTLLVTHTASRPNVISINGTGQFHPLSANGELRRLVTAAVQNGIPRRRKRGIGKAAVKLSSETIDDVVPDESEAPSW